MIVIVVELVAIHVSAKPMEKTMTAGRGIGGFLVLDKRVYH